MRLPLFFALLGLLLAVGGHASSNGAPESNLTYFGAPRFSIEGVLPVFDIAESYIRSQTDGSAKAISFNGEGGCSVSTPCILGSCCNSDGQCGYRPEHCSPSSPKTCVANCDAKAPCGEFSIDGKTSCPLNACCSSFGFCGTSDVFCRDKAATVGDSACPGGSCGAIDAPSCGKDSFSASRRVAYYQSWNTRRRPCDKVWPTQLDTTGITHLVLAFATIDPKTFQVGMMNGEDEEIYKQFMALPDNIEKWLGIGGFEFTDPGPTRTTFSDMTSIKQNRKAFIDSLQKFCSKWKFRGIDIDWEWPGHESRGGNPKDGANQVGLFKEMRQAFGSNFGLGVVIPAQYEYSKNMDLKGLEAQADWLTILTYDLHGPWDANIPGLGPKIKPHTDLKEIDEAMKVLWSSNIDSKKVNMGIANYGRGYTVANRNCMYYGCNFTGPSKAGFCTLQEGVLSVCEIQRLVAEKKAYLSTIAGGAEAKEASWDDQWISFDDADTIAKKLGLANDRCLGGTALWAIDYGVCPGNSGSPPPRPGSSGVPSQLTSVPASSVASSESPVPFSGASSVAPSGSPTPSSGAHQPSSWSRPAVSSQTSQPAPSSTPGVSQGSSAAPSPTTSSSVAQSSAPSSSQGSSQADTSGSPASTGASVVPMPSGSLVASSGWTSSQDGTSGQASSAGPSGSSQAGTSVVFITTGSFAQVSSGWQTSTTPPFSQGSSAPWSSASVGTSTPASAQPSSTSGSPVMTDSPTSVVVIPTSSGASSDTTSPWPGSSGGTTSGGQSTPTPGSSGGAVSSGQSTQSPASSGGAASSIQSIQPPESSGGAASSGQSTQPPAPSGAASSGDAASSGSSGGATSGTASTADAPSDTASSALSTSTPPTRLCPDECRGLDWCREYCNQDFIWPIPLPCWYLDWCRLWWGFPEIRSKDHSGGPKCKLLGCGCGFMGLPFGPGGSCKGKELEFPFPLNIIVEIIGFFPFPCLWFGCNNLCGFIGCDGWCFGTEGCTECPKLLCPHGGPKPGPPPSPFPPINPPGPTGSNGKPQPCNPKDYKTATERQVACGEYVFLSSSISATTLSFSSLASTTATTSTSSSSTCHTMWDYTLVGCNVQDHLSTTTASVTKSNSLSSETPRPACTRAPLSLDDDEGNNIPEDWESSSSIFASNTTVVSSLASTSMSMNSTVLSSATSSSTSPTPTADCGKCWKYFDKTCIPQRCKPDDPVLCAFQCLSDMCWAPNSPEECWGGHKCAHEACPTDVSKEPQKTFTATLTFPSGPTLSVTIPAFSAFPTPSTSSKSSALQIGTSEIPKTTSSVTTKPSSTPGPMDKNGRWLLTVHLRIEGKQSKIEWELFDPNYNWAGSQKMATPHEGTDSIEIYIESDKGRASEHTMPFGIKAWYNNPASLDNAQVEFEIQKSMPNCDKIKNVPCKPKFVTENRLETTPFFVDSCYQYCSKDSPGDQLLKPADLDCNDMNDANWRLDGYAWKRDFNCFWKGF